MGSGHVPRVIFTDKWSNIYYVDWRQRLIKYEHDTKKLVFNRESLPAFPGTPGINIITGITAWAAEATGSDVKDREGNLYFAGRRRLNYR